MSVLRAAIVDDEPLARARLRRLLGRVGGDDLAIVAECVDVDELLEAAASTSIDVLFLDIEMPGGDGFSALARWQGARPQVVFVTAYAEHGVRAFDARATDYLMKPVSEDRLRDTIGRVRSAASTRPVAVEATVGERLALTIGQRTHLVPVASIDVVRADGNYLEVHVSGASYLVRGTLTGFASRLGTVAFVRVHRSAIVRIAAIREIRPLGSGRFRIGLAGGHEVRSGRLFRDQVKALMPATSPRLRDA